MIVATRPVEIGVLRTAETITYARARAHTHTHTRARANTHTRTHAHTQGAQDSQYGGLLGSKDKITNYVST